MSRAEEPKPRWWKKSRVLAFASGSLAALLVIGGATAIVLDTVTRVTVPDLLGHTLSDATRLLEDEGLAIDADLKERDDFCRESAALADELCIVRGQVPAAGSRQHAPSEVAVELVAGETRVPDIVGDALEDASETLVRSGLAPHIDDESVRSIPGYREWKVSTQSVAPNRSVTAGSSVTITLDRPLVATPSVVGMKANEAVQAIEDAGLRLSTVPDAGQGSDWLVITETSPELGGEVPIGTEVSLTWKASMPNLVGMTLTEARALMEGAGFEVSLAPGASTVMKVSAQVPAAGELVDEGATVTLATEAESVVFEVVGNGSRAMVTWIPPRSFSIAQDANASLPWRMTFDGPAPDRYERGNFSAQTLNGNSITCNLYVNGNLVETQTSSGLYSIVSCG